MNETILFLENVSLSRGARRVLAGVSFEVRRGEIIALMGPSGAGKTTVLRVVAGLEPFDAGTVRVNGLTLQSGDSPAATLRALRQTIGMVFQFHHLFEHMTALKNVWLAPVHAAGIPHAQAEARARELLNTLGVESRSNALPRELSGGEAQRVAIARALAVDPSLLLMDEPTAALDAGRRMELADLLRRLTRDGRTLLIATHDEEFARAAASRMLRMNDGLVSEA